MSTARERELTRVRVQRYRERQREEEESAIRLKFEAQHQAIREKGETQSPKSQDLEAQEKFLKECAAAVDVLMEADAFLLWSLHTAPAKDLGIPLPHHIDTANVDEANAYVESFAAEYELSPWRKLQNHWGLMLRLHLLDGLTVPYPVCDCKGAHACEYPEARVWLHISPGYRDLFKQYRKYGVPNAVASVPVPAVPSKTMVEVEDRFLAHMKALDKGFGLGVGHIDWDRMHEEDAKALWYKFQAFRGVPVEPTPKPTTLVSVAPEPEPPEPITGVGEFSIGSFVQKRGGAGTVFKVTGFQDECHALCEFRDEDNNETVNDLVVPLSSLALVKAQS